MAFCIEKRQCYDSLVTV